MPSTNQRGVFIVFEGGDGGGKSTQAQRLGDTLRALNVPVTMTREPGPATRLGPKIRELLLEPSTKAVSTRAEALLFAADRAQHVEEIIEPALAAGHVVISERFIDSSVIYQGIARELGPQAIASISTWATAGLIPDLVIILDVDPEKGLRRSTKHEFGEHDRIEAEGLTFQERVRQGYLDIAEVMGRQPELRNTYAVINADDDVDLVEHKVWMAFAMLDLAV